MLKKLDKKGFTIIEVLIVLAIAGLIMLVVFLAVPALQRNSRNNARAADASRTAAAVNECITNNNGQPTNCQNLAAAQISNYITIADNQQLTAAGAASTSAMALAYNTKCNSSGTGTVAGGGSRAFTISYLVETSGSGTAARCLGS